MSKAQVILSKHESALFLRQAKAERLSLSAWLRQAAHDRLAASETENKFHSVEELESFFEDCDQREQGREPDWEEHLEVMQRSRKID